MEPVSYIGKWLKKRGEEEMKRISKKLLVALMAVVASLAMSAVAFAESTGTANSAVTGAMTTVANDMTATATSIIPIALGVVGIAIVVVFGIKIFKKIINK